MNGLFGGAPAQPTITNQQLSLQFAFGLAAGNLIKADEIMNYAKQFEEFLSRGNPGKVEMCGTVVPFPGKPPAA
jgi:hypothetical protein